MTPADKRWMRDTLRKIVREELAAAIEQLAVNHFGSYDGATVVLDSDLYEGEAKRIGFDTSPQVSAMTES
jgi:hypothetical protein